MSEQYDVQGEQTVDEKRGALKRRGLIAGAAALVAGVLAKQAAEPVAAGTDGDIALNTFSSAGATTGVVSSFLPSTPAFVGSNNFPAPSGIDFVGDGIQGYSTNPDPAKSNAGVFGRVNNLNGVGVFGEAPNGTGVFGDSSSGSGVAGSSSTGNALYGQSSSGVGVFGITSTGPYGVVGQAGSAPGGAGLLGVAAGPGTVAFGTVVTGGATTAGFFNGAVVVNGNFSVTGSKSAAVKVNGEYRLLYCVEAPESWFEDFGTGQVVNGKAEVKLDPEFADLVHADTYHVFIAEHDGHNGLHTTKKDASGFMVEASPLLAKAVGVSAAQVQATFSWRMVAKRKDIKGERLAKTELPKMNTAVPSPPTVPKPRHK